jgi:hypothetical protein
MEYVLARQLLDEIARLKPCDANAAESACELSIFYELVNFEAGHYGADGPVPTGRVEAERLNVAPKLVLSRIHAHANSKKQIGISIRC